MKILIVKLADLGDLLISEPAIRSLRLAFPDARIDLLTTPHAAELARLLEPSVHPIYFDKGRFDVPGLYAARAGFSAARLGASLSFARYDRVALLHHLTTSWGAKKFRALARATSAPYVAGLDNGRGDFLTHPELDMGFGHAHESEYMLRVAIATGGQAVEARPRLAAGHGEPGHDLPERFLAIAPKAGPYSQAREWPLDRFVALSGMLERQGHALVIVGGSDAVKAGDAIAAARAPGRVLNLAGRATIEESAAIIRRASAFIGNDSFPGHLAAAVGTPVVAIFGPSNHRAWAPVVPTTGPSNCDGRGAVVRLGLPCSPCLYTGHRLGRREGCALRSCLTLIEPEAVYQATMELLSA
jgi:heptosyltransferase-2